jgi:hypothetical protein
MICQELKTAYCANGEAMSKIQCLNFNIGTNGLSISAKGRLSIALSVFLVIYVMGVMVVLH